MSQEAREKIQVPLKRTIYPQVTSPRPQSGPLSHSAQGSDVRAHDVPVTRHPAGGAQEPQRQHEILNVSPRAPGPQCHHHITLALYE